MGKFNELDIERKENKMLETEQIKDEEWDTKLEVAWDALCASRTGENPQFRYPDNDVERFLTLIWKLSMEAFDIPREIQVVIDAEGNIYSSVGTPGFVSFLGQEEQLPGMTLPIECWIHTHPFGKAYFSSTDWKTVNTWRPIMKAAIVLGDNQYLAYDCEHPEGLAKKVYYGIYEEKKEVNEDE